MVPGVEGGVTRHLPAGEQMPIYDAAMQLHRGRRAARRHSRGKEYGTGSIARLGGEGHEPARRPSRDRRDASSASTAPTSSAWACSRSRSRMARRRARSDSTAPEVSRHRGTHGPAAAGSDGPGEESLPGKVTILQGQCPCGYAQGGSSVDKRRHPALRVAAARGLSRAAMRIARLRPRRHDHAARTRSCRHTSGLAAAGIHAQAIQRTGARCAAFTSSPHRDRGRLKSAPDPRALCPAPRVTRWNAGPPNTSPRSARANSARVHLRRLRVTAQPGTGSYCSRPAWTSTCCAYRALASRSTRRSARKSPGLTGDSDGGLVTENRRAEESAVASRRCAPGTQASRSPPTATPGPISALRRRRCGRARQRRAAAAARRLNDSGIAPEKLGRAPSRSAAAMLGGPRSRDARENQ